MSHSFAVKLDEWFEYYDPDKIEVSNVLQLVDFTDKLVLEIGCATGKSSLQAHQQANMYFGIDNDIRVIDFCKEKYHHSNLFFLLCSAEKLLFASEFFDIVYVPWVLNYIQDKDKVINEIFRVLKPGGKLVLVESSSECDYDNVLAGIVENQSINPEQAYEIPILKKFNLKEKIGPISVPYYFTEAKKVQELVKFIVEDYLEIKLDNKKADLLKKNLDRYIKRDGSVIFNENPLFYLFEKNMY